jgi:hypothetical protein
MFNINSGKTEETLSDEQTLDLIAPFMPRDVMVELCSGRRFNDYRERKLEYLRWQTYQAIQRQKAIGRLNAQCQTRTIGGGAIRWKMCVDDHLEAQARFKYGRQCWQDPDFLKDTWKKTPEVRVPDPPRRSFPVNGFRNTARGLVRSETCDSGKPPDGGTSRTRTAVHEIPAPTLPN